MKDEIITVLVLGAVCVVSIVVLQVEGKEIVLAIGSGLIGYLKGQTDKS